MSQTLKKIDQVEILPLTPERWQDFETLFGPGGGFWGCWCMWWRMSNKEFNNADSKTRRAAMQSIVQAGNIPGLIAYADDVPAGWAALAPRVEYPRLQTSRKLHPVDDQPVWSIPCFFIHHEYRRRQLMERLIEAACEYALAHGASILEAYPLDIHEQVRASTIFTGITRVFESHGFEVVSRRGDRPVMRKLLHRIISRNN